MTEVGREAATTAKWLVKHAGDCFRCGRRLTVGNPAVYEPTIKRIRCVECPAPSAPPRRPPVGVAGRSSQRELRSRRSQRERHIRQKYGKDEALAVSLWPEPQSIRAWKLGAEGEERLGALLDALPACQTLHDRRMPGRRGNIDHIVVAPTGVFVIDPKNWRGALTLRARGPMTRLESRLFMDGRDRTDKLTRVSHHAALIKQALALSGIEREPAITPVVCFVNSAASLVSAPKSFLDVAIVRPGGLARLIGSRRDAAPSDVDRWFDYLGRVFPPR